MSLADVRRSIGVRHADSATGQLRVARWSAGAIVATWAFRDVGAGHHAGEGLFTSLNTDARDSLACLGQVPVLVPAILTAVSLYLVYGAFYVAARATLVGPADPLRLDPSRGGQVNAMARQLGRGWRAWLVLGWWTAALVAGAVIVGLTGMLLRGVDTQWLAWLLVAGITWLIVLIERKATVGRYAGSFNRPNEAAVAERMKEWLAENPADDSGMPWIYGYSGLGKDEITTKFQQLGSTGPAGFTAKLLGLVILVLIYSRLPAQSVARFTDDGPIGCLFGNLHNIAGVAEENVALTFVGVLILVPLMPLSIIYAYWRFMWDHRFPQHAINEVVRREVGFAVRMRLYVVPLMTISAVITALVLWLSAALADRTDSALVGLIAMIVPTVLVAALVTRRGSRI